MLNKKHYAKNTTCINTLPVLLFKGMSPHCSSIMSSRGGIVLLGGGTGCVRSDGRFKLTHRILLDKAVGVDIRLDLSCLRLLSVPDELERVSVHIDQQCYIEWGRDDNNMPEGSNLLPLALYEAPHVLPLSLSRYMATEIVLHYRQDFILANEEWSLVDDVIVTEEYSDTECEFYDGREVLHGYMVHRRNIPTGRLKREVAKGAQVRLPTVEITLVEPPPPVGPRANMKVAFWQRIMLQPRDRAYTLRLAQDNEMRATDGTDVSDASSWLAPRAFFIKNTIWFARGTASITHVHYPPCNF